MKIYFRTILILVGLFTTVIVSAQQSLAPEELDILLGKWTGSLTYTNYSDGTPFSMPAELEVQKGKNEYQLTLFTSYPNEPSANSKGTIKISKDGSKVNKESITAIKKFDNNDLQITTEYQGKDNRKNALIKDTYIFGKSTLIIRKEVKFEGSSTWLKRNEYRYGR